MEHSESRRSEGQSLPTVVGIGASAGGLAALRGLFAELPADTGATFVVIQHLGRDSESLMPELLAKSASMPVRFVEDGDSLSPDSVYCVPPGKKLRIDDHRFRLDEDPVQTAPPVAIDAALRSLAESRAHRAIGVLLSGAGSDGTLGLATIRDRGGLTFVQDPDEAEFDSMPRSAVRAGVVDYALALPALAKHLVRHLRDADLAVSGDGEQDASTDVFDAVSEILESHSGHDFSLYKPGTIGRRLQRRLRLAGNGSLEQYVDGLRTDRDETEALFRDLLISVTQFFRDPEAWEELAEKALGALVDEAVASDRPIRAWVPGCATGEEAYTLLMLIEEEFGRRDVRPDINLFATDIDERALGFARHGLYPEGIADHVSPGRLECFFTRVDHHYQIKQGLRERCVFAAHNLLQDAPFARQDIISCRNLLIYLQPEAQRRALSVFQYALRPGGHLMIGSSEHLGFHKERFAPVGKRTRIFRRNEVEADAPVALMNDWPVRRRADGAPRPFGNRRAVEDVRRLIERSVFQDFGPASVLVDARLDVLHFFGRTSHYLEPSEARGGSNLIEMAPASMRAALWTALGQASTERQEVTRTAVFAHGDESELVEIVARPARELDAGDDMMLVVFRPVRPEPLDTFTAGADSARDDDADGSLALREMERELRGTRQRLQATIEELEGLNEELRSSNEELLSMNEELQTTKEETQSANEELKTVNAEVRSKIDELNQAHGDLQNLFRSNEVATIFLDRNLEIQRFTPAATALFRLRDSDVGRPIGEIVSRFAAAGDLSADIGRVLDSLEPHETEVHALEGDRWFTLRVFPYRTVDDVIAGAVLTFTDVTDLKRIELQLRLQQGYAEAIVESVPEPIVVLDGELRLLSASPSFFERFGFDEEQARGEKLGRLDGPTWDMAELHRLLSKGRPGDSVQFEVELDSARHDRAQFVAHARRIADPGGSSNHHILLYLTDVTSARKRERAQAEEVRRKDWFLAMLGHEIRNPLAPIRNALDLLKADGADSDTYQARLLAIMERQLDQLTRLVNDMLDVSRITGGKMPLRTGHVDLVEVTALVAEDHRTELESEGLELEVERPETSLIVVADPDRLAQAVGNLLANARRYTRRGGRIVVGARREGSEAVVTVADTGIGMTRALLREVFEPFHKGPRGSDAEQGLGIGLTLVRAIVEEHGGKVEAESEGPGRGSRFSVRLPLIGTRNPGRVARFRDSASFATIAAADPAVEADARPAGLVNPPRVMLIEDMEDAAETLRILLEALGCDVVVATTGEDALNRVWEWAPHIVLSDIGLPGAMDGFDVARAIRADPAGRRMRLIALTGYGRDSDRDAALDAGFDTFFVKPVRMDDLREAIAGGEKAQA